MGALPRPQASLGVLPPVCDSSGKFSFVQQVGSVNAGVGDREGRRGGPCSCSGPVYSSLTCCSSIPSCLASWSPPVEQWQACFSGSDPVVADPRMRAAGQPETTWARPVTEACSVTSKSRVYAEGPESPRKERSRGMFQTGF